VRESVVEPTRHQLSAGGLPLVQAARATPESLSAGTVADSEERLRMWLTGTGTPFPLPGRAGPSTLLQAGGELLLVDCGNSCAYQIQRLGFDWRQVTHIFITHHHVDHNADLAYFLLSGWMTGRTTPPNVIGPPGTLEYVNRTLAAQDYDIRVRVPHGKDPEQLRVRVVEVEDGDRITSAGWRATAFRVDHMPVDQAFGYRFDAGGRSVVISGDTRPCDNLVKHAQGVDVLIHEAIYPGFGIPSYHTLAADVGKVAARARAKHLVLTHLLPGHLPDEQWLRDISPHYDGPVTVGQDLLEID